MLLPQYWKKRKHHRRRKMANLTLEALAAQVTNTTTVMASATVLINGIAARIQTAVDAAIQNGATAEELAPVQAEITALAAGSNELAIAVGANTK
jgi:hypothetical protein